MDYVNPVVNICNVFKILKIIHKVHDVSVVLRCLNTKQLYISRDGQRIKLGHTRGVGILGAKGNV